MPKYHSGRVGIWITKNDDDRVTEREARGLIEWNGIKDSPQCSIEKKQNQKP